MSYTREEAFNFIGHMTPMIIEEGAKRGYKIFSCTIAQALIEGGCGKSGLAKPPYNNHFGIKAGKAWMQANKPAVNMKTKEDTPSGLININDWFRVYSGDRECVAGYYDFLSAKRYHNLKTAKNYIEFAQMLKSDGYATSRSYASNLIDKVRLYNLDVYDEIGLNYYPKVIGYVSIVEALESIGVDGSKANRKVIYNRNFTDTYKYTAKQNNAMLALLAEGKLLK